MKKVAVYVISCLLCCVVTSQITNEVPKSSLTKLNRNIPIVEMPSFDIKKIKEEDKANDVRKDKPFRFGYEFDVDLGVDNSGAWEKMPNGDQVWRLAIKSKGAHTLNFIFDAFELAKGAEVYLYNDDKSFVLGAYTSKMNNEYGSLGTWIADGDKITIEYYVPADVIGKGRFHIGSVIHGYRSVSNFKTRENTLNTSGDCNLDVNCTIGEDLDPIKERLKKSVALILIEGITWCTGVLINNTENDKSPYILTASHCSGKENNWAFRFNWISTNTVCAETTDSTDNGPENYYQVTSGAKLLARNSESDFELVEISGGLDADWDLEWAGWDRTDAFPESVIGIHHPQGDIMKVCRDNSPLKKIRQNAGGASPEAETWDITTEGEGWELGVTEGGSSGSALFDQNGRIIGQLYGGGADCSGTVDNNQHDFYGRFSVSWDFGTANSNRLSNWLDPSNKGCLVLNMLSQENSGIDQCEGTGGVVTNIKDILLFPNPTQGEIRVSNFQNSTLEYVVVNVFGAKVLEGVITIQNDHINLQSVSSGIYFIEMKNLSIGGKFTKKIMVN